MNRTAVLVLLLGVAEATKALEFAGQTDLGSTARYHVSMDLSAVRGTGVAREFYVLYTFKEPQPVQGKSEGYIQEIVDWQADCATHTRRTLFLMTLGRDGSTVFATVQQGKIEKIIAGTMYERIFLAACAATPVGPAKRPALGTDKWEDAKAAALAAVAAAASAARAAGDALRNK